MKLEGQLSGETTMEKHLGSKSWIKTSNKIMIRYMTIMIR
jgi:hypothetical protein